jgi:hypothetical protein
VTAATPARADGSASYLCAGQARRLATSDLTQHAPAESGTVAASAMPEPWVTKRQLARHLEVTPRWIEMQQPYGPPRLRKGRNNRYRISELDAWLRERLPTATREAA